MPNHNLEIVEYKLPRHGDPYLIARSWDNIYAVGNQPKCYSTLEEDLGFLPFCIVAVFKIKWKNQNQNHDTHN